MSTQRANTETVDIYCLVDLTESRRESYIREFEKGSSELDYIQSRFIPWTENRDGTLEDLYRIYEENKGDDEASFFFIDRQCLSNDSIIIADKDHYTLMFSDEAMRTFNDYLAKYPVEGVDEITDGDLEELIDEATERGLPFGRVPASEFRSIWANLDIANMDMHELVEYCGGKKVEGLGVVEMIPNSDWDPKAFMESFRELVREEAKL